MDTALLAAALVFAVVNGANDGSALVGAGLKVRHAITPLGLAALLGLALATVPLLLGTGVAATLAEGLVDFSGAQGLRALLVAVASAVFVVGVLSWRGLPTSLTLAIVGSIAGAGAGADLAVRWGVVAGVLVVGMLAPLVGAGVAFGLSRALRRFARAAAGASLERWHLAAFALAAVAYAANDGQKIFAVWTVAVGGPVEFVWWETALLSLLFVAGMLGTLPRVSRKLSGQILSTRPAHAVVAQSAAAVAVLASAALTAPVSMTQSLAGGLVGTGMSESYRRVRWRVAMQLALAWVITLPASLAVAWLVARAVVA